MEIKDFLSSDQVLIDLADYDKARLLDDLSVRAASALRIDAGVVRSAIIRRETLGSTGIGDGVAIPHARIAGLKTPLGLFARLASPIEFEAIDGKPVDVVFMLLLPESPDGEQLNALASAARKLRDAVSLGAIRKAPDTASIFRALTS
jgi:PTS system nitrogen regulatory IIA component